MTTDTLEKPIQQTEGTKRVDQYDFFDPAVLSCPFAFYDALRTEAPVYLVPGTNIYIISRYEDFNDILKNTKTFSNDFGDMISGDRNASKEIENIYATGWPAVNTMLTLDPPEHKKYRALVNKAFKVSRVNGLEGHIRSEVNKLIDKMLQKKECDFVSEFCHFLPMRIIADQLGVPIEDFSAFKRWSDAFASQLSQLATPEEEIANAKNIVEFQHYFAKKAEERRLNPKDDIITDLVNAELDGKRPLETAELLSILQQLLVAGNETTAMSIADGMAYLIKNPEQMKKAVQDPSIIPNIVEEMLRLVSPTQGLWRVVKRDAVCRGVSIPAGSMLMVRFAAANRDPQQFGPDAESFDGCRRNASDHYAFGFGVHFCVGAMLARKEMVVAFEQLLSRLKNIRFSDSQGELNYFPNVLLRGLTSLRIAYDPMI